MLLIRVLITAKFRFACQNVHVGIVNRLLGFKTDGETHEFQAVVAGVAVYNNEALRQASFCRLHEVSYMLLGLRTYKIYIMDLGGF